MVRIRKKRRETEEEKEARLKKEREQSLGIQDEYQAKGFELVTWIQDHKIIVIGIIVVLLAGGGLFTIFNYYNNQKKQALSVAYIEALKEIESSIPTKEDNKDKWQETYAKLTELAKSNKSMNIAVLSNIQAGHLALKMNQSKNAIERYEDALKAINSEDSLFYVASVGLSFAYEQNKERELALKNLEKLVESENELFKDLALYKAGQIAYELKDMTRAKELIQTLISEYPASPYRRDAKLLKNKML